MNFEPNIMSKKFYSLIGKVFSCCKIFEPKSKKKKEYEEKWLKNSIREIFSEIQKHCDSQIFQF